MVMNAIRNGSLNWCVCNNSLKRIHTFNTKQKTENVNFHELSWFLVDYYSLVDLLST